MVPVKYAPRDDGSRRFSLRLNTGRYRDQWHTMTRTGLSPKLSQHRREPLVEVHPDTIRRFQLADGGLAEVETASGKSIFRVASVDGQRRQEIFVPMHWTDQTSGGGRMALLPSQDRDPISGQPGFKNTAATIRPYSPAWNGFLVTREQTALPDCTYWTRVRTSRGWLTELAGDSDPALLANLLPAGELAEVQDARRGVVRAAVITGGRLQGALFTARDGVLPSREWLVKQLGGEDASTVELLAGRSVTPQADRGPIICVCFDIGLTTILDSIRADTLTSVEAVGTALNAGTNCGSCRPAIARLLQTEKETQYV